MNQPLAYIHPEAKIAQTVVVEPFTTIHKNVEIGEGTWIGPNVTIFEGSRIGKNCKIYPGSVIGAIPQDLKFEGEDTLVEIGDNTIIRECCTINRGTQDKWKTTVGANCLIMAYCHIAHDCVIGDNCILANAVQMAGHVVIDEFAVVGGMAAIHQFVRIGKHTMVRGGSLVGKDIPPFTKAGREPLRYYGINSIGLRRRGFDNEKINEIQEIYRILYLKGYNNTAAMERIELDLPPSDERDMILHFIKHSNRGIMAGDVS